MGLFLSSAEFLPMFEVIQYTFLQSYMPTSIL